ncbi:uncharacterized protein LOC128995365 isoform X2 [Macrosteles quadrilineatus]|uniref:uncharacterized protein LOC128995365 isoform X2 n=1 Tax=Macrosteles quadrilineatus TaxID=74068 RepID=UPI0023E351C7|nr:uncharacterized protein LOC128995365 isoform X2 [Macrosteles quadrilineatus]
MDGGLDLDCGMGGKIQFSQQTANISAYPDAYSATIPKLNLLVAIRAYNVVPDFGMLDIISPTPKRIQTVIRAFCDFYQWCDCRIEAIIDVKKHKKIKEKKQLLANLVREKQNLQEELNNIFITIGQLQDSKKEMEENMMKYQQYASELRLQKDILKTQSEEANARIREKEAVLHKIMKEDSQVSNKIKDYSNQIVNSPTNILTDLETLKGKNEEMKVLSEQKRDMVESKMKAQQNLEEILNSMEGKKNQLDEVIKLVDHQRKLLHIVSVIEKNGIARQEELEELKSSLMSIKKKKITGQEELQALVLKFKTIQEQLIQSIEAVQSELKNLKIAKSKMIDGLKDDAELEEKINSMMEKIKADSKPFCNECEKILNQEKAYLKKIKSEGETQMKTLEVKVKVEKISPKKESKK